MRPIATFLVGRSPRSRYYATVCAERFPAHAARTDRGHNRCSNCGHNRRSAASNSAQSNFIAMLLNE